MSLFDNPLHFDAICRRIADGRRLARLLAAALFDYSLSEAGFRLLWLLRETGQSSLEQSTLVERLGISPAQVSALVEKLRSQQIIALVADGNDRRRKHWQLTASGREFLESVCKSVGLIFRDWSGSKTSDADVHASREDAA